MTSNQRRYFAAILPSPDSQIDYDDRRQIAAIYPGLAVQQIVNDILCPTSAVLPSIVPAVSASPSFSTISVSVDKDCA